MPALDQQTIIIIVVAAVLVIALGVVVALLMRRRRERHDRKAALRQRFGPEYDRAVADSGSERDAVEELSNREERHSGLSLRDLEDDERDRVRAHMAVLQYRFVEEPAETLLETQRVVTDVLDAKGYPIVSNRAEGLRMLSVDHPMLTQPVRALLQGEYGDDVAHQRHLFLDVRTALRDVAGISYDLKDAAGAQALPAHGVVQDRHGDEDVAHGSAARSGTVGSTAPDGGPMADNDGGERAAGQHTPADDERTEGNPT